MDSFLYWQKEAGGVVDVKRSWIVGVSTTDSADLATPPHRIEAPDPDGARPRLSSL